MANIDDHTFDRGCMRMFMIKKTDTSPTKEME